MSIAGLVDQLGGVELPNPITVARAADGAGGVADPRQPRGVRHGLVVVLTSAVCAVRRARSFVAIAEWVADLPADGRRAPGHRAALPERGHDPRGGTGRVDADRFDTVLGDFVQDRCAALAAPGAAPGARRRRQDRARLPSTDPDGVAQPGRHLLAVIDQHSRVVLGQVKVEGKTNEVRREAPCRIPDSVRRNLGIVSGLVAYPEPKGDGDQSMP